MPVIPYSLIGNLKCLGCGNDLDTDFSPNYCFFCILDKMLSLDSGLEFFSYLSYPPNTTLYGPGTIILTYFTSQGEVFRKVNDPNLTHCRWYLHVSKWTPPHAEDWLKAHGEINIINNGKYQKGWRKQQLTIPGLDTDNICRDVPREPSLKAVNLHFFYVEDAEVLLPETSVTLRNGKKVVAKDLMDGDIIRLEDGDSRRIIRIEKKYRS